MPPKIKRKSLRLVALGRSKAPLLDPFMEVEELPSRFQTVINLLQDVFRDARTFRVARIIALLLVMVISILLLSSLWKSNDFTPSLIFQMIPNAGQEFPRAIPRTMCARNGWQEQYAEYHTAVLSLGTSREDKYSHVWMQNPFAYRGKNPSDQRFVVFVCPHGANCGGTSDRILGITTAFYIALYTRRVFLIDFQDTVKAERVFSRPNFDWSMDWSVWQNNSLVETNLTTYDWQGMVADTRPLILESLKPEFENNHMLRFHANRGYAFWMWENPKEWGQYRDFFMSIGLTQFTLFPCVMDYILAPKPYLVDAMADILAKLRDLNYFTVGLQVRVGDWAFAEDRNTSLLTPYYQRSFFQCAHVLHARYGFGKPLAIFFITDSVDLKKAAALEYGKLKNVTFITLDTKPRHVEEYNPSEAIKMEGYESLIQDMWLFSEAPYKVVSSRSGIGSIAAYRSYWRNHRTIVRIPENGNDADDACRDSEPFTTYRQFAEAWSGG
jgi:hypothetical protein